MQFSDDGFLPSPAGNGLGDQLGDAGSAALQSREIIQALRRRIWLILALTTAITAAAAWYASTQPPLYRARATIRLRNDRQALTGGLASDPGGVLEGSRTDPVISRIQVLKSRAVIGEVVDREGLRLRSLSATPVSSLEDLEIPAAAAADTIRIRFGDDSFTVASTDVSTVGTYGSPAELPVARFTIMQRPSEAVASFAITSREELIDKLASEIQAIPRERTDIIDISYADPDPARAQRVVNALTRTFDKFSVLAAQEMSRRRREFLGGQLVAAESTLRVAQDQVSEFRQRTEAFSAAGRYSAQQAGLTTIEMNRAELQADRATYRVLLERLRQLQAQQDARNARSSLMTLVASPGIAENPVVQQLYQRLVQYETGRDTATAGTWGSTNSNPAVVRLDTLIAQTRAQLVEAVESHIFVLDGRIRSLTDLRERTAGALATLPTVQAQEDRLLYEVQSIRELASELRGEFQKARITEAVATGDVEVVDMASLPTSPLNSRRFLIVILGLAVGVFGGSATALFLEKLNSAIRHSGDVQARLQLRTLAIIPAMSTNGRLPGLLRRLRGASTGAIPAQTGTAVTSGTRAEPLTRDISAFSEMNSATAEAYRTLRTNLMFSQVQRQVKTVVVTSTAAGEGKTTTASNLAVALARQGLKVLVVDCDMRRPRLHEAFSVTREPGFTQLLMGASNQGEAIRPTIVENLSVLPCGAIPPNPSELLSAPRTRELLTTLEAQYDTVILDTPPMLASADAAVLAARVDGVLIVVRAGSTDSGAARQAIDQLRFVGANILGAVLNDPDGNLPGYGKYHYYYSDYATTEA